MNIPKPKFKVGDKIKIIDSHYYGVSNGRTGTILENRNEVTAKETGVPIDKYFMGYVYYVDINIGYKLHLTFKEDQLEVLNNGF